MLTNYGETINYIRTKRLSPLNRVGKDAILLDEMLYCFGGDSEFELPFALSTQTWAWSVPAQKFQEKVQPMTGSAIAAANGKMYFHGGRAPNVTMQPQMYVITPNKLATGETPAVQYDILEPNDKIVWRAMEDPEQAPDEIWV
jgi:hypothetical protein